MSHVVIAFKQNKSTVVFQGTYEQAQAYQWSSKHAADLLAQGYTDWQLKPAKER
jgi:hypothetical protein